MATTKWHIDEAEWYADTLAHWTSSEIESHDNEGVLGGWGEVDVEDAKGSLAFIRKNLTDGAPIDEPIAGLSALDCGAGVGRVTESVLARVAESVHLVEVSDRLLQQAQAKPQLQAAGERLRFEQASLREFAPPENSYNLVWAQWVLGHLTCNDVVGLLNRCRQALRPDGAIVVKDNIAAPGDCDVAGKYLLDKENAAVIRSNRHLTSLFKLAQLKVSKVELQSGFPADLHPVKMYWLVPIGS